MCRILNVYRPVKALSQIYVNGLTHVYSDSSQPVTALANLDMQVERSEFIAVIGPSGGGKTTLLKLIAGLLKPTAGIVKIDGMSPVEAQRRRAIGCVFQDPSLLPWRTVLENIALPLTINREIEEQSGIDPESLLEKVGLKQFRDHYPHELSGGMKQRVAFARALVINPKILLMDEPLSALDDITRTTMRHELLSLWEQSQQTVMFITHSVSEAVMMSNKVVVMSDRPGRIIGVSNIDLPRPRHESLETSTGFLQCVKEIKATLSSEV